jgi:hypothetical protein
MCARAIGIATAGVVAALLVMATATPAGAAVSISAPSSRNLGSAPTGSSTLSAQLGTVTASASGLLAPDFIARVSCTVFTTGARSANETIGKASIRYWSGPATSVTGLLGGGTPGQPTAAQSVDLTVTRTAFTGQGTLLAISGSWNPTLIINIPASAIAGTYSGTITHSVA